MARYVKPLSDFDKVFEIYFNNKNEIKEFEDNGEIFGHEPFQDYISNLYFLCFIRSSAKGLCMTSGASRSLFYFNKSFFTF